MNQSTTLSAYPFTIEAFGTMLSGLALGPKDFLNWIKHRKDVPAGCLWFCADHLANWKAESIKSTKEKDYNRAKVNFLKDMGLEGLAALYVADEDTYYRLVEEGKEALGWSK